MTPTYSQDADFRIFLEKKIILSHNNFHNFDSLRDFAEKYQ